MPSELRSRIGDLSLDWKSLVSKNKVQEVEQLLGLFYSDTNKLPFKDVGLTLDYKLNEVKDKNGVPDNVCYMIRFDQIHYVEIFLEEDYYQTFSFNPDEPNIIETKFDKFKLKLELLLKELSEDEYPSEVQTLH